MLKKHTSFLILFSAAALYSPLCLKLCFSYCLFKAPPLRNTQTALIGQLTQAWASTANCNRAVVLN